MQAIPATSGFSPVQEAWPRISASELAELTSWALRLTGISFRENKQEFLSTRLSRRLAAARVDTYAEYLAVLRADATEQALFAEALTTHTTSFFRERAQYDWLREEGLAALAAKPGGSAVFWSAACSTGQEAYSALMTAEQTRPSLPPGFTMRVVGTDISRPVLRTAAEAIYDRTQIRDIPEDLRPRCLLSSRKNDGRYRIVPELRRRATWRQANLVSGAGLGDLRADIVFLRNVLIYFDEVTRESVIDTVVRRLRPGGFLCLGHTEGSHARRPDLEIVRPSIYRKKPQ